jgi:hypothetical protein
MESHQPKETLSMNFNDIELRLRYPHVFRKQEYFPQLLQNKAASVPRTPAPKLSALNWLITFFRQRRHGPT